ncbi:MAG: STAS domain-containing protein [Clostridia bacterium]|nr:STAS domain-containing protein [Clostridia bacterium]
MTYKYEDGNLNLSLNEELDMNSCKMLRTVMDGYIMRYQPKECVVDLSEVTFMDSSGIGLILGRYNLLKLIDSKMTILNPSGSIKRLLEVSNISNHITLRCE